MFFEKKYVFETNTNRIARKVLNIVLWILFFFAIYNCLALILIVVSNNTTEETDAKFFNHSPDIIVVFTGDIGRIGYALEKAREFKQTNVYITGVYSKNTVSTLLEPYNLEEINPDLLEIDYEAQDTVGNVISTLTYLRERKDIQKVLIISHNYHILRIKLLFDGLKKKEDKFDLAYTGIKTDYTKWRNIKILYKEIFKLVKALVVLLAYE